MAAIFFDIDGTLLNWQKEMPESTREALRRLRENGHKTFLCTGRTRVFVDKEPALQTGFDGMLYGCGTHIVYGGEDLFYYEIPLEDVQLCMDTLTDYDMPFILEGRDYFYSRPSKLAKERYGQYILESMNSLLLDADVHRNDLHVSKLLGVVLRQHHGNVREDIEGIRRRLGDRFLVMSHADRALEIVPLGYTKATAIQMLCDKIGLDPADTYAVGDGNNDIEMLQFAGTGIAMGDGSPHALEAADYVTSGVDEDGIFRAMEHFKLI